ncbi:hypothetical protein [Micromonospora sp. NPDC004551]|uniref:hypothetical protein n=1 Tax=Micromonospora sp. NPDC004551 TaxID=3154284 RepID=UPI0033ADD245
MDTDEHDLTMIAGFILSRLTGKPLDRAYFSSLLEDDDLLDWVLSALYDADYVSERPDGSLELTESARESLARHSTPDAELRTRLQVDERGVVETLVVRLMLLGELELEPSENLKKLSVPENRAIPTSPARSWTSRPQDILFVSRLVAIRWMRQRLSRVWSMLAGPRSTSDGRAATADGNMLRFVDNASLDVDAIFNLLGPPPQWSSTGMKPHPRKPVGVS